MYRGISKYLPARIASAFLLLLIPGCISSENAENDTRVDHVISQEGENGPLPLGINGSVWGKGVTGKPVAIPGGVAILSEEGVFALDGTSGDELWRYVAPGSKAFFSTDGSQVVIGNANLDGEESNGIVLDSNSGEVEGAIDMQGDTFSNEKGPVQVFSEFGYGYRLNERRDQLQALSFEGGQELWRTPDPFQCNYYSDLEVYFGDAIASEDLVFANFACAEGATTDGGPSGDEGRRTSGVLALDALDGSEVWRVEEDIKEDVLSARSKFSLSSDGGALIQNRVGLKNDEGFNEESRVFDLENGEEIFTDKNSANSLIDFDVQRESAVIYAREEHAYFRVSTDGTKRDRAQVPAECSVRILEDEAAVLENGILTGCEDSVGTMNEVRWLEWGSDDPGAEVDLGVEYDALTEVIAVPGAVVVAYERDGEPAGVVGLS